MKPKKSLGQNFLTSKKAVLEIVSAGDIVKGDAVLEIGPGKGALTEELLKSSATKIIAVEKDKDLMTFLSEKFKEDIEKERLILIRGDILDLDISKTITSTSPTPPKERLQTEERESKKNPLLWRGRGEVRYKLIANIPYYITGAIIERFLSIEKKPEKMVLLVQKEVAERIVAKNKKESILSLAVKLYGTPKIVYRVSAGSFFPKPKVDSAVLKIDLKNNILNKEVEAKYFKLIKKAFSHKRKVMLNNLKNEWEEENWEEIFEKLNLNKKVRAEDLDLDTFLKIVYELK